jgi:GNAT superfamily N-acetyltransferase
MPLLTHLPLVSALPSRFATGLAHEAGSVNRGAMTEIYRVRPAVPKDVRAIIGLIDKSADWLRTKGTDQWARPWPNEKARDDRIVRGIRANRTWMIENKGTLVGTITYRREGNKKLWTLDERREPSVYISRLIVSRRHAGRGVGAALIDWAGRRGIKEWNAGWIRVDVWTINYGLHNFYKNQGFTHLRTCSFKDPWDYPSAALFQKPTVAIDKVSPVHFKEVSVASTDLTMTLLLQP